MDVSDIFGGGLDLRDALDLLGPLAVYVLVIAGYGMVVFKYYRFVASRDMFALDLSRYEGMSFGRVRVFLRVVFYVLKYLVLFPVFAFFWFAVLTLILAFLSKEQSFSNTLLIAVATVSAIRVTAYYSEELSRDLAKILPFAVIGVFLIDASVFSLSQSIETLRDSRNYVDHMLYYLAFLIALEFVLRIASAVARWYLRQRARVRAAARAGKAADGAAASGGGASGDG